MARSGIRGLAKLTKEELILRHLIDDETSPDEVLRLARETKAVLLKRIRARQRWLANQRTKPCPKGHEPGDPACNLVDCWIVNITPYPSPFLDAMPKVAARNTVHQWVLDDLTPEYTARARDFVSKYSIEDRLSKIMKLSTEDTKRFLDEMAQAYKAFDAQFAGSKRRRWWEGRVPVGLVGWWVLGPLRWWLYLAGIWKRERDRLQLETERDLHAE